MTQVVALGADDQARVRMPSAAERRTYGLADDEPVVEIRRWNGTTEVHGTSGREFAFVSGDLEPDKEARLTMIQQIVSDLRSSDRVPTEEQLVVRYGVSRTTVRRALSELRASR